MEIKKVEISMKNPENYPIKGFAQVKKITTLIFKKSVALIVNTTLSQHSAVYDTPPSRNSTGFHTPPSFLVFPLTFNGV